MNFGIIGFGNIARKFVKSIEYTDKGVIYAIGSHSLDSNNVYLKNHPSVQLYRSYDELLDDSNIDAVYISLPHSEHKKWIIKAIQKGKAVLCEKPLVLYTSDIEEINKIREEYQGYYLEALKTKMNTAFFHLKEDIHYIGKIKKIEACFCFEANMNKRQNTYLFDSLQGGALNDVGSYLIGFVLGLIQQDIIDIRTQFQKDKVDTYFYSEIIFQDDIIAYLEGGIDRNKERLAVIYGEKGKIIIPNFNRMEKYQIMTENISLDKEYPIYGDDMTLEIQSFINDITSKKKENQIHSYEDMKNIISVIERMREGMLYE